MVTFCAMILHILTTIFVTSLVRHASSPMVVKSAMHEIGSDDLFFRGLFAFLRFVFSLLSLILG